MAHACRSRRPHPLPSTCCGQRSRRSLCVRSSFAMTCPSGFRWAPRRGMTSLAVASCLVLASQVGGYNWTKPGLAWPNSYYVPMAGFDGNNTLISSYYNWSPSPVITPKGYSSLYAVPFPFIPMLWGCNATYTDPFQSAVDSNFSNAALTPDRVVLGFNEPDITGQSDCSPSDAASAWKIYLEPLRSKGYRVGSPAVSSGTAGKGWLEDWFEACGGGCNPDFIALHWVSEILSVTDGAEEICLTCPVRHRCRRLH
jgi:hypothetical protein